MTRDVPSTLGRVQWLWGADEDSHAEAEQVLPAPRRAPRAPLTHLHLQVAADALQHNETKGHKQNDVT